MLSVSLLNSLVLFQILSSPQCFRWYIEFVYVTIKLNEPVFLISTKLNYFILMQQFLSLAYYSSIYEDTDTKERRN